MFSKSILIAALLASAPIAAAAYEPLPQSVRVSTKGLNLNSDAGAEQMVRRIDSAVTKVCGLEPTLLPLARKRIWRDCATQARTQALTALGNAKVTELATSPRRKTQIAAR